MLAGDRAALSKTGAADADASVSTAGDLSAALPLTRWSYVVTRVSVQPGGRTADVQAILHYRLGPDPADATARRSAWSSSCRARAVPGCVPTIRSARRCRGTWVRSGGPPPRAPRS